MKWFAFPPHIVRHVVEGLQTLAMWIEQALEWISRELL
jgi:hypothetical protein